MAMLVIEGTYRIVGARPDGIRSGSTRPIQPTGTGRRSGTGFGATRGRSPIAAGCHRCAGMTFPDQNRRAPSAAPVGEAAVVELLDWFRFTDVVRDDGDTMTGCNRRGCPVSSSRVPRMSMVSACPLRAARKQWVTCWLARTALALVFVGSLSPSRRLWTLAHDGCSDEFPACCLE